MLLYYYALNYSTQTDEHTMTTQVARAYRCKVRLGNGASACIET